jgi:hypothetical protein
MRVTTTADVVDLLDASFPSAALGAAGAGLFWMIDEAPDGPGIAVALGSRRPGAQCWLLLEQAGLLGGDRKGSPRQPRPGRRSSGHSAASQAFLALEARERLPVLVDLPCRSRSRRCPGAQAPRPGYVERMSADAGGRRFTRMLEGFIAPSPKSWLAGSTRGA